MRTLKKGPAQEMAVFRRTLEYEIEQGVETMVWDRLREHWETVVGNSDDCIQRFKALRHNTVRYLEFLKQQEEDSDGCGMQ